MKKLILAASIASLFSGAAFAAVDLDATPTGAAIYASELVTNATTAITDNGLDTTVNLGFGVSNAQTRYIRFDLGNAKFNLATAAASLTVGASTVALAQGGAAGDSYVIFQITAGADYSAAENVIFALGSGAADGIKVTDKAAPATITYSLYETGADAVAGGAGGRLSTKSGAIATFSSGVTFSATPITTTIDVSADTGAYTKFVDAGVAGRTTVIAQIGTVTLDVTAGALTPAGAPTAYADFVAAGTKLVLTASDSLATATATTGLYIGGASCAVVGTPEDAGRTATTVSFTTGVTAQAAAPLCYAIGPTYTAQIPAQTFTVAADITPAAGTSTADYAAVAAGTFVRNGTVLKAAFAESSIAGTSSVINLANTSAGAAAFTTSCLTTTGRVAGAPGSVPANSGARFGIVNAAGLACPANTRGVELTFAVPANTVIGSVVRQNTTTGAAGFDGMVGN